MSGMEGREGRFRLAAVGLVVAVVLAAFGPVLGNGFVAYDDEATIVNHPVVAGGLTPEGIIWAFRALEHANWMPVTRLSHLLDVSLFGMDARGQHLVSLLIHAAVAWLLMLLLWGMTGSRLAALVVAILFAVHPLRVESVAWASERKDVLAGLFWMLSLLAWVGHLRRPSVGRYLGSLALFILGIMAKPSVVTLPLVLLLLDFWPLGRLVHHGGGGRPRWLVTRLVYEKVPFLVMSAAASVAGYLAQRAGGAVDVEGVATPAVRVATVATALLGYLEKTLWPRNLSIIYLHTMGRQPVWRALWGGLILAGVTALALAAWRRRPYLTIGWLWYPLVLLPMSGLIQAGVQGMADRYTYLPLVGPVMATVWWLRSPAGRHPFSALVLLLTVTVSLSVVTWRQTHHWRDSVALFSRAVAVDPGNPLSRVNLGHALTRSGRLEEANRNYRRALETFPRFPGIRFRLADNALTLGRPDEAVIWLGEEVGLNPGNPAALDRLAQLLARVGRTSEALDVIREEIRLAPGNAQAHGNLGLLLAREGRMAEAQAALLDALRLDPNLAPAREALRSVEDDLRRAGGS